MTDEGLLTATGAAHLISAENKRPFSPDGVRYHSNQGHLPTVRTASGVRLFRPADVRQLARTLAGQTERRGR